MEDDLEEDELEREVRDGLRQLDPTEFDVLNNLMRESHTAYFYGTCSYDPVILDPDLALLLSLLYMSKHSDVLEGYAGSKDLFETASRILDGDVQTSRRAARHFLYAAKDASGRKIVRTVLSSDAFCRFDRQVLREDELCRLSKPARRVYECWMASDLQVTPHRYHRRETVIKNCSSEKLTHKELDLLLTALKSFSIVRQLLVPLSIPRYLSQREIVEDAIEHARLVLIGLEGNIFYGCDLTYADVKAAASSDASATKKLIDSSQLLSFILPHPSERDKSVRDYFLTGRRWEKSTGVLTPRDYPTQVPSFFQDDISEKELEILRVLPSGYCWTKERTVETYLLEGHDYVASYVSKEVVPRLNVCLAFVRTKKILPSAQEVYCALLELLSEEEDKRLVTKKRKREDKKCLNNEKKKKRD